jgi:hypothetical protein
MYNEDLFTRYYKGDQSSRAGMGRACSRHGKDDKYIKGKKGKVVPVLK